MTDQTGKDAKDVSAFQVGTEDMQFDDMFDELDAELAKGSEAEKEPNGKNKDKDSPGESGIKRKDKSYFTQKKEIAMKREQAECSKNGSLHAPNAHLLGKRARQAIFSLHRQEQELDKETTTHVGALHVNVTNLAGDLVYAGKLVQAGETLSD